MLDGTQLTCEEASKRLDLPALHSLSLFLSLTPDEETKNRMQSWGPQAVEADLAPVRILHAVPRLTLDPAIATRRDATRDATHAP